jgi:hypothetical protein
MKKNLPKSIDDIEFIPFVGRDIDLNTKGKPSLYLRNVIIPYYRKVIRGLESEIVRLRKSKKELLDRKNKQISAKRWLKYKSNQERFAVQQKKVKEKAVEITKSKVIKAAFEKADLLASIYYLPVYTKLAKESGLRLQEFVYIVYTSNFKYLTLADYKEFFGESFSMTHFNACRRLKFIDTSNNITNSYFLSLKGRNLIKKVQEEIEVFKDE